MNMWILHSVSRARNKGFPETLFSGILMVTWHFGALWLSDWCSARLQGARTRVWEICGESMSCPGGLFMKAVSMGLNTTLEVLKRGAQL